MLIIMGIQVLIFNFSWLNGQQDKIIILQWRITPFQEAKLKVVCVRCLLESC